MRKLWIALLLACPLLAAVEDAWRARALPEILRQQAVLAPDSEGSRYVTALGWRLVNALPQHRVSDYRFILYDDDAGLAVPNFGTLKQSFEANALPGAVIVVPLSLFTAAADEGEFAAGLARAIAHVALRHFAQRARFEPPVRSIPPAIPRLLDPPRGNSLRFTRTMEWEADTAAVGMLAGAGFDPQSVARLVRNPRTSFDTSERRAGQIEQAIAALPPGQFRREDRNRFELLRERLRRRRANV